MDFIMGCILIDTVLIGIRTSATGGLPSHIPRGPIHFRCSGEGEAFLEIIDQTIPNEPPD